MIAGHGECSPCKDVSHLRVVLGLFYILEWWDFCRKRLEVYHCMPRDWQKYCKQPTQLEALTYDKRKAVRDPHWWRLGSNSHENLTHSLGWFFFLKTALLRHKWHTINFTYLKCTIWSVVTYIYIYIYSHPWSHHHNQENKHIHHPQNFLIPPCNLCLLSLPLPQVLSVTIHQFKFPRILHK